MGLGPRVEGYIIAIPYVSKDIGTTSELGIDFAIELASSNTTSGVLAS
jgi:hypothetical protein